MGADFRIAVLHHIVDEVGCGSRLDVSLRDAHRLKDLSLEFEVFIETGAVNFLHSVPEFPQRGADRVLRQFVVDEQNETDCAEVLLRQLLLIDRQNTFTRFVYLGLCSAVLFLKRAIEDLSKTGCTVIRMGVQEVVYLLVGGVAIERVVAVDFEAHMKGRALRVLVVLLVDGRTEEAGKVDFELSLGVQIGGTAHRMMHLCLALYRALGDVLLVVGDDTVVGVEFSKIKFVRFDVGHFSFLPVRCFSLLVEF